MSILPEAVLTHQAYMGPRECSRQAVSATAAAELEIRNVRAANCRILAASAANWVKLAGNGGHFVSPIGGFSHDGEHDLAAMVSDFLENGSGGTDSRCSSDSDSGHSDLALLAEKISFHKHHIKGYESDLLSLVRYIIISTSEAELQPATSGLCNACCIRQSLVKHLMYSGYDAALCSSKWQGSGKVPGGEYEYIDVVIDAVSGAERVIIDIDFRSHFEIARAIESYNILLKSLPVVYVGSLIRLNKYLQVMVDAAKCSLKQNAMPLPPWRSLAYVQAKWHSLYERKHTSGTLDASSFVAGEDSSHNQCIGHLRRLKLALQCEIEMERLLRPLIIENNQWQ